MDNCKQVINIHFYKVPKQILYKDHYQYLMSVISFYFSKQILLPKIKGDSIGIYERLFNIFCVSYHLKSDNCISAYWCFNGKQLRFYPCDMINLWPKFFEKAQITISKESMLCNTFKNDQFDRFYEDTTRQKLVANNVTEDKNRSIINIMDQCIDRLIEKGKIPNNEKYLHSKINRDKLLSHIRSNGIHIDNFQCKYAKKSRFALGLFNDIFQGKQELKDIKVQLAKLYNEIIAWQKERNQL